MSVYILGIESSCDDTSAAILRDTVVLSNITTTQEVHRNFGGVVPELASRAHQQNIIPVIDAAINTANISKNQVNAVAFTRGPGLLGSLLVGVSFAKAFALGMNIPLIEVDHMQAHILAHFIHKEDIPSSHPSFPFICLTVSGGHTQMVLIRDFFDMEVIGQTIDDAAGETFDKAAKILGLPYPGGPFIDTLAQEGDPARFPFALPKMPGLDFSFSGLKTSILYFIRDELKKDPGFILNHKADLAASIQSAIVTILIDKIRKAMALYTGEALPSGKRGIRDIAIAGGVSANSGLRNALAETSRAEGWNVYIPPFGYTTDNAAMIAAAGYFKYLKGDFSDQSVAPYARMKEWQTGK
jgi:N6-L-threonylcarbamoyladenine synthase